MYPQGKLSLAESLALLPSPERQAILATLTEPEAEELLWDWRTWARPAQILPGTPGAAIARNDWVYWVVKAGRGFGKTRTGAETVREWANSPDERILMIAPTADDVRSVMLEGPSGLLNCYPPDSRPVYNPSRHLLFFPSGALGITRSADEPERLRGPQFTKFWADELCAWRYPQEAWDQLSFGFRLKTKKLQGVITTTPKPLKVFKALLSNQRTVVTSGSSYDNRMNLSEEFFAAVIQPYEGTRLGRQEINAEVLEDTPGALWTRSLIDAARVPELPRGVELTRVVIPVDPAVSTTEDSDLTGIVPVGLGSNGHIYVLADLSGRMTPGQWAVTVLGAYVHHKADRVIGEVNNGGDLVEANLRSAVAARGLNPMMLPFRSVHASRGKAVRAEPVAALYEKGMVHHVGALTELEEQMCGWVPGSGMDSPDRMDALVWGIWDLVIEPEAQAIVTVDPGKLISPY